MLLSACLRLSSALRNSSNIVRGAINQVTVAPLVSPPPARHYTAPHGNSPPDAIWRLGRLNHVAIACADLDKSTALYRDVLRAKVSGKQDLPEHGVTTVFVELDNTKLELLHPLGENSPIQGFLDKNKNGGIHHVCIEVNDVVQAMADVQKQGIRTLSKEPRTGAHGKPVVFLHPKDCAGVLVELEQV